jgi:uncharacterized protein
MKAPLIVLICASMTAAATCQQAEVPASREHVLHYFKLIGIEKEVDSLADQMIAEQQRGFASLRPDIPSAVWDEIRTELRKGVDSRPLQNTLVTIYQRRFDDTEMTQILAFYETPVGQKLLGAQMLLYAESYMAESKWKSDTGNSIADHIVALAKVRGYDFDQPPPKKAPQP